MDHINWELMEMLETRNKEVPLTTEQWEKKVEEQYSKPAPVFIKHEYEFDIPLTFNQPAFDDLMGFLTNSENTELMMNPENET